ncbi:MAG TPA: GTP-binding protein [Draconibacterium sp.]|nr:GTP-binding protein [Draconibacterium sp.]
MVGNKKISVSIITGFLGAGKTTFINHLLKNYAKVHFALVENEFGDVAIDSKLIKGVEASQMFELKEGCICCTINDEFELVLQELAERFPNVEHLLIETTGVADPASVIRPFFRDENLQEIYSFQGTVCLVDALNFEKDGEKELKNKQVAIADFILISKSEKMSSAEKDSLKNKISQLNPLCEIHFAEFGNSPHFKLEDVTFQPKFYPDFPQHKTNHIKISTKTLTFSAPLNRVEFVYWLSYTLDVYKNEIYRVKGILCFDNEPFEYILQGVGGSFEIVESEQFVDGSFKSKIVLMGKLNGVEINTDIIENS